MRQFLASFILLGYHLLLSFFVGSSECDLQLCKRILDEKLEEYPDGAFFLYRVGDAWASRNMHAAILDAMRVCAGV